MDLPVIIFGYISTGVGAALMMARTNPWFRGIAAHPDDPALLRAPEEEAALVNAPLALANASCMFGTMFATFAPNPLPRLEGSPAA